MSADGSVVFEVKLDDEKAQKKLEKLGKDIGSLESQIEQKEKGKLPLEERLDSVNKKLEEAKKNLSIFQDEQAAISAAMQPGSSPDDYIEAFHRKDQVDAAVKAQQAEVDKLEKEWQSAKSAVDKYDDKIEELTGKLNAAKAEAGGIEQQLAAVNPASKAMGQAMERMEKSANRFALRLKEVVRSALVFTLITQALAQMRKWMGKVIQTNAEASAAVAKLRGALLTLAQPIIEFIIPAFVMLVNVLTRVISVIAQLISMLFGKTFSQSKEAAKDLNKETEALEGVGAAAEEAAGSLAGFDEINTISTEKSGGGGAGGAATAAPDFNLEETLGENQLKNILDLVKAIGSALLAWKISKALELGLKNALLLFGAIYSAATFLENLFGAWTGGVTMSNALGMIASALATALLLFLALGKTMGPIAAGISLIVTGLLMLVTGFRDAMKNGWSLENLLLSIAGILATGIGIGILIGSWIPLLIAGIASLLLAATVATGHGEELLNGIRTVLDGFLDFFTGIFTGDFEKAFGGIEKIFEGFKTIVGSVIDGVRDTFLSFLDWLDEKTHGKFSGIIGFMKDLVSGTFDWAKEYISNAIEAIKKIFLGVIQFITGVFTGDWETAWEGVKNIFKGAWNGIVSALEGAVNLVIRGVNWLIDKINGLIGNGIISEGLKFLGVPNGRIPRITELSIPRLAAGAVIPPNREFMAVLGDQRSGNNLEAPESLIRKIVREEAGGMNTELLQAILEAIRAGQVIKVNETVLGRTTAKAINKVTQTSGKPVLLY